MVGGKYLWKEQHVHLLTVVNGRCITTTFIRQIFSIVSFIYNYKPKLRPSTSIIHWPITVSEPIIFDLLREILSYQRKFYDLGFLCECYPRSQTHNLHPNRYSLKFLSLKCKGAIFWDSVVLVGVDRDKIVSLKEIYPKSCFSSSVTKKCYRYTNFAWKLYLLTWLLT